MARFTRSATQAWLNQRPAVGSDAIVHLRIYSLCPGRALNGSVSITMAKALLHLVAHFRGAQVLGASETAGLSDNGRAVHAPLAPQIDGTSGATTLSGSSGRKIISCSKALTPLKPGVEIGARAIRGLCSGLHAGRQSHSLCPPPRVISGSTACEPLCPGERHIERKRR